MAKTKQPAKRRGRPPKHKHGQMDVSEQLATFDGFITWTIRLCVLTVAVLILLAATSG